MSNEAFDRWWEGYPEKVGKGAARKAFARAMAKTSLDQLVIGLDRYKATKPLERPWCHPATWLNQERWLDVPANGAAELPNGKAAWYPYASFDEYRAAHPLPENIIPNH